MLANFRQQSGPVLTSGHALSCLLHLLIASAIALVGMAEDNHLLGSTEDCQQVRELGHLHLR